MNRLQHGDPNGSVWRPGETDVSIRPGWFNHPAEDTRVKSVDALVGLYFTSVGRNSKLLLNVPPTRDGLLHENDVANLAGMRRRLDAVFSNEISLDRGGTVSVVDLREDIATGQSVARYVVEGEVGGAWHELSRGTTIGYRKLDRVQPTAVSRVRVRILESMSPAPAVSL